MKGRVLVIDDEKNVTVVVRAMLEKAGFEAEATTSTQKALDLVRDEDWDTVITDLKMPKMSGMEVLQAVKKVKPRIPVVMVTAFATVESAVSALKQGAFDFISKPFEKTELINVISKSVSTHKAREESELENSRIIGKSAGIQKVLELIKKVANTAATVLIHGESGTGKELVAFELHQNSARSKKPFIKINCAAIPENLIESELFGHERGAFTGAVSSKPGRFELAHEGTLFLDEIAEMSLEMQAKLLRVMQEKEFERVGGVQTKRVDVRIIAASNRNLKKEVESGRFREDLFYRLNVLPVSLPPLRERKEDIVLFVKAFIQNFSEKLNKNITDISPECLSALQSHNWPGNIRQLENIIERMMLMADGPKLTLQDLPSEILPQEEASQTNLSDFKRIVRVRTQTVERDLIHQALETTSWNVTRAAEALGLSRKGLQLKMKELGVRRA